VIAYIKLDVAAPVGRCWGSGRCLCGEGAVDGSCKPWVVWSDPW